MALSVQRAMPLGRSGLAPAAMIEVVAQGRRHDLAAPHQRGATLPRVRSWASPRVGARVSMKCQATVRRSWTEKVGLPSSIRTRNAARGRSEKLPPSRQTLATDAISCSPAHAPGEDKPIRPIRKMSRRSRWQALLDWPDGLTPTKRNRPGPATSYLRAAGRNQLLYDVETVAFAARCGTEWT